MSSLLLEQLFFSRWAPYTLDVFRKSTLLDFSLVQLHERVKMAVSFQQVDALTKFALFESIQRSGRCHVAMFAYPANLRLSLVIEVLMIDLRQNLLLFVDVSLKVALLLVTLLIPNTLQVRDALVDKTHGLLVLRCSLA